MTDREDTKIRAIRPDVKIDSDKENLPPPDEQVIALCTELLSLAEEGTLQELNYTAGDQSGYYRSGSVGDCGNEDGICAEMMRMAIARSQMGMMIMSMEDDYDD